VFTELKKLIAKRSLTITVAVLDDEQIRVNVVPHARPADSKVNEQIKYSNKSEVASVPEEAIKALTTPISITGTAEEIDAKFPAILCDYLESHVRLQETLDRARIACFPTCCFSPARRNTTSYAATKLPPPQARRFPQTISRYSASALISAA
jgi:PRTRC genetic system protein E